MNYKEGKSPEWCAMFDKLVAAGHSEEEAAKMANTKMMSNEPDKPETYDLPDVEIFAAGKWKGEEYSTSDLDNMVHNFGLLGRQYKAPLKLGHDDKQALAQADGYPAVGWVKGLKRSGEKLLATFTGVPKKIKQLIDRGAYARFSSEILWNFSFGGNQHKRVLKAVALLGADAPAVTSITDILNLYSDAEIPQGEVHAYHDLETKGDENMPENEALKKELDEAKANIKKMSDEKAADAARIALLEKQASEREAGEFRAKVYSSVDDGIKAGKIPPVAREYLAALALAQFTGAEVIHKFSDGKGEIKAKSSLDILGELIAKLPADSKFTGESTQTEDPNAEKKSDTQMEGGRKYSTDESLDKKIRARMEKDKCSYSEAYQKEIREVK